MPLSLIAKSEKKLSVWSILRAIAYLSILFVTLDATAQRTESSIEPSAIAASEVEQLKNAFNAGGAEGLNAAPLRIAHKNRSYTLQLRPHFLLSPEVRFTTSQLAADGNVLIEELKQIDSVRTFLGDVYAEGNSSSQGDAAITIISPPNGGDVVLGEVRINSVGDFSAEGFLPSGSSSGSIALETINEPPDDWLKQGNTTNTCGHLSDTDLSFNLVDNNPGGNIQRRVTPRNGARILEIAFDTDFSYTTTITNPPTTVAARVQALLNTVSPRFARFNTTFQITHVNAWTSPDPYDTPMGTLPLQQVRLNNLMSHWRANFAATPRDHVHFLTARTATGYAGYASGYRTCPWSAAWTRFNSTNSTSVFAHELGHIFGSDHTGCYVTNGWNDLMCGSALAPFSTSDFSPQAIFFINSVLAAPSLTGCFYHQNGQPYLQAEPADANVALGAGALFSGRAQGAFPESYQYHWERDGIIIPGSQVSSLNLPDGANSYAEFRIPAVAVGDNGALFTLVATANGYTLRSRAARLTVTGVPPTLAADFNRDGIVSPADIFDFLNAWFAGNQSADTDRDGQLAPADIFAFLNLWFGGSP